MEKTLEIGDKTYTLRELKYKDVAELSGQDEKQNAKILLLKATGLTEEEYEDLSMKDGVKLMKLVNEMNGIESDFQGAKAE